MTLFFGILTATLTLQVRPCAWCTLGRGGGGSRELAVASVPQDFGFSTVCGCLWHQGFPGASWPCSCGKEGSGWVLGLGDERPDELCDLGQDTPLSEPLFAHL